MKPTKNICFCLVLLNMFACSSYDKFYDQFKTVEQKEINPYDQFRFSSNEFPITKEIANNEYLEEFKKISCKKIKEDECVDKYKAMFKARLKLIYKQSDVENINQMCIAYPVECNSNQFIEKLYVLSNNYNVDVIEKQEKAKIQAKNDAESAALVSGLLIGIANQQNKINEKNERRQEREEERNFIKEQLNQTRTVSCTTNAWGNTIHTNCNNR